MPACSRCVEISTSDQDTRAGKDSRRWNEAAEVGLLVLCCCCSTQHARTHARARARTTSGPPSPGAAIAMDGGVADTSCYSCPYMTRRLPVPVTGSPRCLSTVCVPAPPVSFYRVCPGSPRCLFTGTVPNYCTVPGKRRARCVLSLPPGRHCAGGRDASFTDVTSSLGRDCHQRCPMPRQASWSL